jgi:azurin
MKLFSMLVAVAMTSVLSAQPNAQAAKPTTQTAKPAAKPKAGGAARTVNLTGSDQMKYDVTTVTAKPGERLHIVLKNVGQMPKIAMAHNFVLLNAGADVDAFTKAAISARDTDYVPASMKADVIGHTTLAGPGETVETTITVPSKPGNYTFLCSFPGHYAAGMKGTLTVK